MENNKSLLSKNQINRLPSYLHLLKKLQCEGLEYVHSQMIADYLEINNEKVKKDIALISSISGIPNKGRKIEVLIKDIESILGYDGDINAILIGVGSLGNALLRYDGFKNYGLNIIKGFDVDKNLIGKSINNIEIMDINKINKDLLNQLDSYIAILTVNNDSVDEVCEILTNAGIKGIWNFTSTTLKVDKDVIVEHIDLAVSLARLSHKLFLKNYKNQRGK